MDSKTEEDENEARQHVRDFLYIVANSLVILHYP